MERVEGGRVDVKLAGEVELYKSPTNDKLYVFAGVVGFRRKVALDGVRWL
jgi:hypothetical protein